MLDALDRALAEDWGGFQLQRTEPEHIRDTHAMRMDIKLAYKGKPWGTVQLEVAPAEGHAGQEIDRVSARPLDPVREACVEIFELRNKHAWPPDVTVHRSWAAGFAAMATDTGRVHSAAQRPHKQHS